MPFLQSPRGILLAGVSALALIAAFDPAWAGAPGGHFASGNGTIAARGGSLAVTQSSATGIIDWSSFGIGKGDTVTFDNGAGATLNEVTGGDVSTIAGSLRATGSLYLINPSGVIIAGTGRVVTGGSFAASTESPDGRGDIVVAGSIHAARGAVRLAGENVDVSGRVAVMRGGQLWLVSAGATAVSGTLDADNARGRGGVIVATGKSVAIAGTANIEASGVVGGSILIGGDVHGRADAAADFVHAPIATAQTTSVAKGAQLTADARAGRGGDIVIWSDGHTSFAGALTARGTTQGGFAEVSSHDLLAFTGTADLTTPSGAAGTLLLDPENVTISSAATSNGGLANGVFTPTGSNSVLNVTTLETALATANVKVTTGAFGSTGTQAGDITIASPLAWASSHVLTLDAYQSIAIDALVALNGAGGLALKTDNGGSGGTLSFSGGRIAYNDVVSGMTQGSLKIDGVSYTLVNSIKQLASDISANASGDYALANSYNASADGTYTNAPIVTTFNGSFQGLGNEISNLTINANVTNPALTNTGLFSVLGSTGIIANVGLVAADVSVDDKGAGEANGLDQSAGLLVGVTQGLIENSYATGVLNAYSDVVNGGGLAGQANGGSIANSHTSVTIVAVNVDDPVYPRDSGWLGGLVGSLNAGSIIGSYAAGAIKVNMPSSAGYPYRLNGAGGLVGYSDGAISGSYATGDVTTNDILQIEVGGLAGSARGGSISDCYATGAVTDTDSNYGEIGGLVGAQYVATISGSSASGNVSTSGSNSTISGLVGLSDGAVSNAYAKGNVSDTGQNGAAAGFVGISYATIGGSYATGSVSDLVGHAPDIGGFVAEQYSGTISGSFASGKVNGNADTAFAGGFAGVSYGALESDHATGAVVGGSNGNAGGLVGEQYEGTIVDSYATGVVNGSADSAGVGGLVGEQSGGAISGSYATGNVEGGYAGTGGLVGDQQGGTISTSYASGAASGGSGESVGGFAGVQGAGTITQSYATGTATSAAGPAEANVGGFIGLAQGTITESYSTGNATGGNASGGQDFIGGFIGLLNGGTIANTYSTGSANAGTNSWVGGFVGAIYSGTISDSYSTGSAGGAGFTPGGFAGNGSASEFSDDYWDTTTSGITNLAQGAGNTANVAGIAGLSTAQFQSGLPAGFSSTVWGENASVEGGLPYLLALPHAH